MGNIQIGWGGGGGRKKEKKKWKENALARSFI